MLAGTLCVGMSMGLTSCKDDEKEGEEDVQSTLTLDEKVTRFGVETDMESAIVPLNVKCQGEWTAAIEKGTEWVSIQGRNLFFKGNQTLELVFDENRTEVDRTATLYITDDADEVHKVTLRQTPLYKGEAPDNSNIMTFGSKGLGLGVNMNQIFPRKNVPTPGKYDPTAVAKTNSVYNLAKIYALMTKGAFGGETPYVEEIAERAEASIIKWDSLVTKNRTLDATLNLEISFGFFNMQVGGHYEAADSVEHVGLDYALSRDLALYNAYISPTIVRNYAVEQDLQDRLDADEDWEDEQYDKIDAKMEKYVQRNQRRRVQGLLPNGLTLDQQADIDAMYDAVEKHTYGGVFTTNFAKLYQRMLSANRRNNEQALNDLMEQLDAEYGPFIIGRTVLGGSFNINCWLSNTYLSTHGALEVKAALEGDGVGALNGELYWSQNGVDYVRNSKRTYAIYGGNAGRLLTDVEAIMNSENPRDSELLDNAIHEWVTSLYGNEGNETSRAALIAVSLTGIWQLFDDAQVQNKVKQFFLNKYADYELQKYVDIMYDVTQ